MLTDEFENWTTYKSFLQSPTWRAAFNWIAENASTASDGYHYDFENQSMFARVMSYDLKSREDTKYESHKYTIDLQYTLIGCEGIEYTPTKLLNNVGDYISEKDFQFYETPSTDSSYGLIKKHENHFCVLWPSDGHMPQMKANNCEHVRKLVVKIPTVLVDWQGTL
jgi:biofilm protein TabA